METTLSARTRVYDYIWAGLPVLMTAGDETAEMLKACQGDLVLESYDEESLARALLAYASDRAKQEAYRRNILDLGENQLWTRQVEPIAAFLRQEVNVVAETSPRKKTGFLPGFFAGHGQENA